MSMVDTPIFEPDLDPDALRSKRSVGMPRWPRVRPLPGGEGGRTAEDNSNNTAASGETSGGTSGGGGYRVTGRYLDAPRWLLLRRACYMGTRLGAMFLLAAALLPAWMGLSDHLDLWGVLGWITHRALELRIMLQVLLTDWFPAAGRAIYYTGTNPYDWHLLALAVVGYRFCGVVSLGLTWLLTPPLWLMVTGRLKLTITGEAVTIHRRLSRVVLPRCLDRVTFRTTDPGELRSINGWLIKLLGENKPHATPRRAALIMRGLDGRPLAFPLHATQADRIVSTCHTVLNWTQLL